MHFIDTKASVVIIAQTVLSSHGGSLAIAICHQRNNLIKIIAHYDEIKKRAYDSQIVRTKEPTTSKPVLRKHFSVCKIVSVFFSGTAHKFWYVYISAYESFYKS